MRPCCSFEKWLRTRIKLWIWSTVIGRMLHMTETYLVSASALVLRLIVQSPMSVRSLIERRWQIGRYPITPRLCMRTVILALLWTSSHFGLSHRLGIGTIERCGCSNLFNTINLNAVVPNGSCLGLSGWYRERLAM